MEHEEYMSMALDLAQRSIGSVEPNPAVGCVIVAADHVIGTGYHQQFGGPHAEINALADCKQNGIDPAGAAMYVTLEPCCHVGKTGPCSKAVIEAGISKVIIAAADPCPHVAGGGIEQLKQAGIEVEVGLCQKQARLLNAPFYKHAETGTPWVIAKWAQSTDGFMASKTQRWVSSEASRRDVHNLRRRCQGILVGIDTVIADDPLLTVRLDDRPWPRQPLRIVLDSNLKIPDKAKLLNTFEAQTLIVITSRTLGDQAERINALALRGVQILAINETAGRCDLAHLLAELGRLPVQQLLVEGGPKVITEFVKLDLIDEIRVYISAANFSADGYVPITRNMKQVVDSKKLDHPTERILNSDRCLGGLIRRKY
jgi:diaminohydroxyphosphoribosylaminopyrimidine deaminase/5-amino-6-(5-phosphoribosylamino)uracil reductase